MESKRLGLIVNPIAGIGGRVGLKGSDGLEIQQRALALGAEPLAQERAAAALNTLRPLLADIKLLAPPDAMGAAIARCCGFNPLVIPARNLPAEFPGVTSAEDTRHCARLLRDAGVDLILFAGGDGTARDMFEAVGSHFPVLGIPAGVKIHSAVYGVSPRSAGDLAAEFLLGRRSRLREAEVLDLDEATYRQGRMSTRLYGYLSVPYWRELLQNRKVSTPTGEAAQAQSIAADVIERMQPGLAYLLGPGTTTRAIAERLGLPKTLIGVDIVTRDKLLETDVGERRILEILEQRPLGLIVTPIGGQGFLFGRGNQQLSPQVIRRVGRENILVICLASKIAALQGRPLLVDTGDPQLDRLLAGYVDVVTGYREKIIYKVTA
jgi:predicted polyphosphate/ATP-dependent NAD kinase